MMNKTKAEIEQMASFICREKGQYMFNKKKSESLPGYAKTRLQSSARTFLQPVTAELSYISSKMY
ncbi:MAG: hypothetical protein ACLTSM_06645 [Eubacterium sp.]